MSSCTCRGSPRGRASQGQYLLARAGRRRGLTERVHEDRDDDHHPDHGDAGPPIVRPLHRCLGVAWMNPRRSRASSGERRGSPDAVDGHHLEQPPLSLDPLELVHAVVGELEPGSGDRVAERRRNEDLPRLPAPITRAPTLTANPPTPSISSTSPTCRPARISTRSPGRRRRSRTHRIASAGRSNERRSRPLRCPAPGPGIASAPCGRSRGAAGRGLASEGRPDRPRSPSTTMSVKSTVANGATSPRRHARESARPVPRGKRRSRACLLR